MEEDASRGTAWRRVLAGGQRGGWCKQGDNVEEGASRGTAWRRILAEGQRGGGC